MESGGSPFQLRIASTPVRTSLPGLTLHHSRRWRVQQKWSRPTKLLAIQPVKPAEPARGFDLTYPFSNLGSLR